MKELTKNRATAALPIAGGYRSIDFVLSSMSSSRINKVGVITQYNSKSLTQHLNSSKWWDFGRKKGGLFVFTPTQTHDNSYWYRGTADAIAQNIDFLKSSHEPYVIIASGDCVYKMDMNKLLEYHIEKNADVTIVTKDLGTVDDPSRFERAGAEDGFDLVKDIFIRYKGVKKFYAYPLDSYWSNVTTVDSYFKTNMDFLDRKTREYFFNEYPQIASRIEDLPPAKYNVGAKVKNSLVSSGCIINGEVEDSVLFKEVYIGNNCTIRNSIILNEVYIGDNTYIENCIVESHGTIRANSNYVGSPDDVKIIQEKNERYVM